MIELLRDDKESASLTMADVIRATANNFPEQLFRLSRLSDEDDGQDLNELFVLRAGGRPIKGFCDGIGTKPELHERMFEKTGDYRYFELPPFDLAAMTADDASRNGFFVAAFLNNLDLNSADDPKFVEALARGLKNACDAGRFALMDGETAELGARTPGYDKRHLNWNGVTLGIINEKKRFHTKNIRPKQLIVGLRERSIRSNGLTSARAILEHAFLMKQNIAVTRQLAIVETVRRNQQDIASKLSTVELIKLMEAMPMGTQVWEQPLPWHHEFPEITEKLLQPSKIYTPFIYEAQGGIEGDVRVPIVAAAHISGGGIPKKVGRMLKNTSFGAHIEAVFPDPDGIPELLVLAQTYPTTAGPLVTDRSACDQWNRGIGFLCVVEHQQRADELIALAAQMKYEAAVAGEIIPERNIEWRGHTWNY